MFGFLKRQSKKQKLEKKFKQLMQEWHALSQIDRSESDKKFAEAQAIAKILNKLKHEVA
ncbi:Lacal_2735 family protein [Tamlana fucoidanivorans]|uniref:Lacal_2735 family protein n=1 Tax=Allotamlana fucoidanivorans TaxID=2583814 RepID=A0A5C4SGC5_9FLAO|nr:Lacal_2735 family protein [Tamlana fucoidanivorans]TNJ42459.1 Lacal_2735 family protein [Tamlana fucoidanivorans]